MKLNELIDVTWVDSENAIMLYLNTEFIGKYEEIDDIDDEYLYYEVLSFRVYGYYVEIVLDRGE